MSTFSPVKSVNLCDAVAQQILDLISEGALQPGDRLPTEVQLMKQFEVGRSTLREALQSLSTMGVIETRRRAGTFITGNYINHVSERMKYTVLLNQRDIQNIMEVRRGLEIQTATLAAQRATDEQRAILNNLVSSMKENIHDEKKMSELDIAFHLKIAQISDNPLLTNLVMSIKNIISDYIIQGNIDDPLFEQDLAEHCRINEAIQSGSPQAAAKAMLDHLDSSAQQQLSPAGKRSSG